MITWKNTSTRHNLSPYKIANNT